MEMAWLATLLAVRLSWFHVSRFFFKATTPRPYPRTLCPGPGPAGKGVGRPIPLCAEFCPFWRIETYLIRSYGTDVPA
jgi:hypothetical protein